MAHPLHGNPVNKPQLLLVQLTRSVRSSSLGYPTPPTPSWNSALCYYQNEQGHISAEWVSAGDQLADILTKPPWARELDLYLLHGERECCSTCHYTRRAPMYLAQLSVAFNQSTIESSTTTKFWWGKSCAATLGPPWPQDSPTTICAVPLNIASSMRTARRRNWIKLCAHNRSQIWGHQKWMAKCISIPLTNTSAEITPSPCHQSISPYIAKMISKHRCHACRKNVNR